MSLISSLNSVVGAAQVLTGAEMDRYARDWMGKYHGAPVAVVRPASTAEVAGCVRAVTGSTVIPREAQRSRGIPRHHRSP